MKAAQLNDWLASMGVLEQFNPTDLESGRALITLLCNTAPDCPCTLLTPNTALNRLSNWNAITQQLKRRDIKFTQEQKTQAVNGNHDTIFNAISRLRDHHEKTHRSYIAAIDPQKPPNQASSTLEILLLLTCKHFELVPKEAAALLSNDAKYLAHILAKGLKGDFRPVDNFLLACIQCIDKIVHLSATPESEVFLLKCIKPALISKSGAVAQSGLKLLHMYMSQHPLAHRMDILQDLMSTCALFLKRHPQSINSLASWLLHVSEYHGGLLQLLQNNQSDLYSLLCEMWMIAGEQGKCDRLWAMNNMRQLVASLSGSKDDNARELLIQICSQSIDDVITPENQESVVNNIQNYVHSSFTLLSIAGSSKHAIAPILFKSLVSQYSSTPGSSSELHAIYLLNFLAIYRQFPSVPIHLVVQAIQEKEVELSQLQFQVFMELLQAADVKNGLILYNLVSKRLIEETTHGTIPANTAVAIIKRFKDEQIVIDMTLKLIKVSLAVHFANAKKICEKKKSVKPNADDEGLRAKNIALQYFFAALIHLKLPTINGPIESLLCFSYQQLKQMNSEFSKRLGVIISKLGDLDKLVSKYALSEDQPRIKNESKMESKNESKNESKFDPSLRDDAFKDEPNESSQSRSSQRYGGNQLQLKRKSISLHPVSLLSTSVASDASKGLEKYQRIYLKKIENVEGERQKKLQEEERVTWLKKLYQKKMLQHGIDIRRKEQAMQLYEFDSRQKYDKHIFHMDLWDGEYEQEREVQALQHALKRYDKLFRAYFVVYAGKKAEQPGRSFGERAEKHNSISAAGLMRLLKDNGMELSVKQVQFILRKLLYRTTSDLEMLNYQGFKEFLVQASYLLFSKGNPICESIQQLVMQFKQHAPQNKFSPAIFDDPEAYYVNESEAIKVLNRKLTQNPDYILPEGYKKIVDTRLNYKHCITLEAMTPTYKHVFEIVEEILFNCFKVHVIEATSTEERVAKARPNLYMLQRISSVQTRQKHLPISFRKEVAKYPFKDRQICTEAAYVLNDILQAVELQHNQVGLKHQNTLRKQQRQKEQEEHRGREQEQRKRLLHDKEVKNAIESYKQKKDKVKDSEQKQKQEETQKERQEREKREKRDKQLKMKIEQHNLRKKEEEEREKEQQRMKQQKEKEEVNRKRAKEEEIKKKIEQAKTKREEQQKNKKAQEKQENRRKAEEEKKKFEEGQRERKMKLEQYKQQKTELTSPKTELTSPKVIDRSE